MKPEIAAATTSLGATGDVLVRLASGLSPEVARWKPAADRWSILEVVNHLADEEVEDFRTRLDILLRRPADPFPPIDPQGWVTERAYSRRDLEESIDRFREAREGSLQWLGGLHDPRLENACEHPSAGRLTARGILASWVAHDLLHIRQITRLRYQHLAATEGAGAIAYAGPWQP